MTLHSKIEHHVGDDEGRNLPLRAASSGTCKGPALASIENRGMQFPDEIKEYSIPEQRVLVIMSTNYQSTM